MTTWEEWVESVSDGASAREIADRIGGANTTVSRWLRSDNVPAEAVIAIARAFNADAIEALQRAGYLSDDDIRTSSLVRRVKDATTLQLLEELMRRELSRAEDDEQ